MKAEEICVACNEGKEYRCCCAICVLKPVGERYVAVVHHVGTLVWKADGSLVPIERLENWEPVEPDPPQPPQPTQRIEEWLLEDDEIEGLQLRHPHFFMRSGCRALDFAPRDPRWLGYYIYKLPDGQRIETCSQRLIYNTHSGRYREVICYPQMRAVRDMLLTPSAVPMLVEDKP